MEINEKLLSLAAVMASQGYTPENKGIYSDMPKPGISNYTPENIFAIYMELETLFTKV